MQRIQTARLALEPQTAAHADTMFDVLSDPAIYEFENEPPASLAWLRERYRRLESRQSADGSELWLNWVAQRIADGRALGYVQATVYAERTALIAYEFASAHWSQGYAREAVTAMCDALASHHGVLVVGAVFKRPNHRSRALLSRLGMTPAKAGEFPLPLAADDEDAMRRVWPTAVATG